MRPSFRAAGQQGAQRVAPWLLGLALLLAQAAGGQIIAYEGTGQLAASRGSNATVLSVRGGDGKVQLKLCECERATGAPNGLSCDKEGWFITGFERQGQWVAGGGFVPLSHAVCCRPCLPEELPPDPSGAAPAGQAPLAVISLGCHASTDSLPSRCEQSSAGSFVAGFTESIKVFTTPDTYYPVNNAQCCTPSLLLPNGDAWELDRCDCHDSTDPDYPINCGGTATDELLMGYLFYRLSPMGHVVPVGPAQCCKVCLSSTVHPINQCADLNGCSNHGVCNLGQCECFDGYTGADCSQRGGGSGSSIPGWAVALIVLSSCAVAGMLMAALGAIIQAVAARFSDNGEGDDDESRQPLLLRIDADDTGSVGSADTADCEDDLEEVEDRMNSVIQRLEGTTAEAGAGTAAEAAAARLSPDQPPAGEGVRSTPDAAGAETHAARGDIEMGAGGQGGTELAVATPAPADASAVQQVAGATSPAVVEVDEPQKQWHEGGDMVGPLAMVDCIVCMARPVQAVLVPCGHVCVCRRCSRRLQRCPVCRKDIVRRQRLFV